MHRFNNPDKGAITHAIVHRALWEYLATIHDIQDETEQEKFRREIFERYFLISDNMILTDHRP